MEIAFQKYHGAGNDFILIDGRQQALEIFSSDVIQSLCHRRFGIGADGLIIVQPMADGEINMHYFNQDSSSGMCGNGARCATAFSHKLGLIKSTATLFCFGSKYEALYNSDKDISIAFPDVKPYKKVLNGGLLDLGAMHYVENCNGISDETAFEKGRILRFDPALGKEGANVNFVEKISGDEIKITTYERGVENLTFACGTGAVAAAIAQIYVDNKTGKHKIQVTSTGGSLFVDFENEDHLIYKNVFLSGPAQFVFEGKIKI